MSPQPASRSGRALAPGSEIGPDWTNLSIGRTISRYGVSIQEAPYDIALKAEQRLEMRAMLYHQSGTTAIFLGVGNVSMCYVAAFNTTPTFDIYRYTSGSFTLINSGTSGAHYSGYSRIELDITAAAASNNYIAAKLNHGRNPATGLYNNTNNNLVGVVVRPFVYTVWGAEWLPYYLQARVIG